MFYGSLGLHRKECQFAGEFHPEESLLLYPYLKYTIKTNKNKKIKMRYEIRYNTYSIYISIFNHINFKGRPTSEQGSD